MDVLVRNARLLDGRVVSLGIADGFYVEVTEGDVEVEPELAIDAEGRLVTPSFVNAHMHLDKVYTLPLAGDAALASYTSDSMGEAMRSIVRDASAVKQHYDRSWIVPNVRRALDEAVLNGVLHVQAFVDVDTTAGLEGMARCSRRGRSTATSSTCRWWPSRRTACCATRERPSCARRPCGSGPTWSAGSPGSSTPTATPPSTSPWACRLAAATALAGRDAHRRRR